MQCKISILSDMAMSHLCQQKNKTNKNASKRSFNSKFIVTVTVLLYRLFFCKICACVRACPCVLTIATEFVPN